ncbi:MAG TPA: NAD(P)H-dependent oxidoreductase subunit E [Acidobacteriota bacterium]|nr:NAD(P)H-dependent oxidoreductase subunit E [Acidobacteriota bacterium]
MDQKKIDEIIDRYPPDAGLLIQALLEIQREYRWLPEEALEKVGDKLQAPANRIRQIVTFYKAFSLMPKGRHEINVCTGTACHVRGAPRIIDAVREATGIGPGETDTELKFTLETVNCVGCCALGPVIVIDGEYHGKMVPSKTEDVLKKYK